MALAAGPETTPQAIISGQRASIFDTCCGWVATEVRPLPTRKLASAAMAAAPPNHDHRQ